jgi:hypothetical protein
MKLGSLEGQLAPKLVQLSPTPLGSFFPVCGATQYPTSFYTHCEAS